MWKCKDCGGKNGFTQLTCFHCGNPKRVCDTCACQEGRHYCTFHSEQVKNMDVHVCDYWTRRTPECQCDLDKWQPDPRTGHTHVCPIHKATLIRSPNMPLSDKRRNTQ
jgi:hypothetical protein